MIFLYKWVVYILLVLVFPFLPFLWLFSKKRRANLVQRFGFNTGIKDQSSGGKRIWVHALSVGEVVSAVPFVKSLKAKVPSTDIVFTTSTKTGFDIAQKLLQKPDRSLSGEALSDEALPGKALIDQLGYFPFDIGYCINKICRQIQPDAVVIVETDLWPNFLYEMKKNKIPVMLINARLSTRSLKGYLFFKPFSSLIFASVTAIMAQSQMDKQRFEQLVSSISKIEVTGNIKFDQPSILLKNSDIQDLKAKLFLQPESMVFIAGSTHEGEEKILLAVFKKIKKRFPQLMMIIAPRDPERSLDIESYCRESKISAIRMTKINGNCKPKNPMDVIVVDKMGELSKLYAICDVAFIGGSMVQKGGHNPLEAAAVSKPVFFGSDMSDFVMISNLLLDNGGAKQVMSQKELTDHLEALLEDNDLRKRMGHQNFDVFKEHSGAVQNILEYMETFGIV